MVQDVRQRLFLHEDWHAETHCMDAEGGHRLKHGDNFLLGDAEFERLADVTADAGRVHVRAGCVDGDRNQFPSLGIDYATREWRGTHVHELLGPDRVELRGRIPVWIPSAARAQIVGDGRLGLGLMVVHVGLRVHGQAVAGTASAISARNSTSATASRSCG